MKQSRIENILLCLTSGQVDIGWTTFLATYSDLMRSIIHQFETDDSAADDCYEFVCAKFSDNDFHRLQSFDPSGPARFRTWLTTVTMNLCRDWRRSIYGRQRLPRPIQKLPQLEQLVYRHLFHQGMTHHECLHALKSRFPGLDKEAIARINAALYEVLSETQRWQSSVRRNNAVPVDDPKLELEAEESRPDRLVQHDQDRERLGKALARLEPDQRLLLQLRYNQDLTLHEIARLTDLDDPFKARRAIDKALSALQKVFDL
jgi:RNA polymerase sigma factor (sigma-70 family)